MRIRPTRIRRNTGRRRLSVLVMKRKKREEEAAGMSPAHLWSRTEEAAVQGGEGY